jgi:hypothetical protein
VVLNNVTKGGASNGGIENFVKLKEIGETGNFLKNFRFFAGKPVRPSLPKSETIFK